MAAAELNEQTEFEQKFADISKDLLACLEKKDVAGAIHTMYELQKVRDESLYQEIGRLTRTLHDSIRNFNIDADVSPDEAEENAQSRLAYVVDMTAKAANKTMDKVEESMPLSEGIAGEASDINQEWKRFLGKEMKPDEFRELTKRISTFLDSAESNGKQLNKHLSDILLAQDYQDLTGQVIQKVAKMITDVEAQLVNLVAMAGHVDRITGIEHELSEPENTEEVDPNKGDGPQINAEEKEDVAASQDDVDDLLSSLGF